MFDIASLKCVTKVKARLGQPGFPNIKHLGINTSLTPLPPHPPLDNPPVCKYPFILLGGHRQSRAEFSSKETAQR